jgi:hypothetical protein
MLHMSLLTPVFKETEVVYCCSVVTGERGP